MEKVPDCYDENEKVRTRAKVYLKIYTLQGSFFNDINCPVAAWPSGTVSACRKMGREIVSRQATKR
jgi:hypothetical protein